MRYALLFSLLAACGSDSKPMSTTTFGGDRAAELRTPDTLTEGKQYPLIVSLHGFTSTSFAHSSHFQLRTLTDTDAAMWIAPDGTMNRDGNQFWDADPVCCDLYGDNPDDVGYLGTLVEDIVKEWPIDEKQIYFMGHSNGGYMSYRMACERADLVAGIVSLAGNAASTPTDCNPSEPVSILHVHGTADATVPFGGGPGFGGIGAVGSVEQWAAHDGCATSRTATVTLDLDTTVAGSETTGEALDGCPSGVGVELWSMAGSSHIPFFNATFVTSAFTWLADHKRK